MISRSSALTAKSVASSRLQLGPNIDVPTIHNLFFAILPDPIANAGVTSLTRRLSDGGVLQGRPVDSDRRHVTLVSVGGFGDQIPTRIIPDASNAAATIRMAPFDITFGYVGGTRGPFLLRACDELMPLRTFREALRVALIRVGLCRPVSPAFNPHLTLSYDLSDVPEIAVNPIAWTVKEFVLIESLFGKHRHILRGRWVLRG